MRQLFRGRCAHRLSRTLPGSAEVSMGRHGIRAQEQKRITFPISLGQVHYQLNEKWTSQHPCSSVIPEVQLSHPRILWSVGLTETRTIQRSAAYTVSLGAKGLVAKKSPWRALCSCPSPQHFGGTFKWAPISLNPSVPDGTIHWLRTQCHHSWRAETGSDPCVCGIPGLSKQVLLAQQPTVKTAMKSWIFLQKYQYQKRQRMREYSR